MLELIYHLHQLGNKAALVRLWRFGGVMLYQVEGLIILYWLKLSDDVQRINQWFLVEFQSLIAG